MKKLIFLLLVVVVVVVVVGFVEDGWISFIHSRS